MKCWEIVVASLVAVPLNAAVQFNSGTIIDVQWMQDEIVVVADSRQTSSGYHSYSDMGCKISTLGGKIVFAASGIVHVIGPNGWDAYTIANQKLGRLTRKNTPDQLTMKLAQAWGNAIKIQLERVGPAVFDGLEDRTFTTGLFAEFDKTGKLSIVLTVITHEISGDGHNSIATSTRNIPEPFGAYVLGRGEIDRELAAQQSTRSIRWLKDIQRAQATANDPLVEGATRIVQLTIDNFPKIRTDIHGQPFSPVGPPIAVVRWKRGRTVEWIKLGKCPAQ